MADKAKFGDRFKELLRRALPFSGSPESRAATGVIPLGSIAAGQLRRVNATIKGWKQWLKDNPNADMANTDAARKLLAKAESEAVGLRELRQFEMGRR